ncbi:sulfatase [Salinisphaera sp. T31B1]|uniref:sulfatase n=1 Tax=Salinisphaera sp. T31B1 TaxID=727963 RepID=UPI00334058DE
MIGPRQETYLHTGRVLLGVILLWAALAMPDRLAALTATPSVPGLPVELCIALAVLCIAPYRLLAPAAGLIVVLVALVTAIKLADIATFAAFNRAFNPLLDHQLPGFGWNVLSTSIGTPLAVLSVVAVLTVWLVVMALIGWALAGLRVWPGPTRGAIAGLCLVAIVVSAIIRTSAPGAAPLEFQATRLVVDRTVSVIRAARDLHEFRQALAKEGSAHPPDTLLAGLAGHDVLLVFVESYGRTVFERPLYAQTIGARLSAFEGQIAAAGFDARSGWLRSPTAGGQSWLAHGTLLSGLWIDNQPRYEALVDSERVSLNRQFARAGWRTAAVMPAITRDWPQARWFGYDRLYDSRNLGYAGPPFNWVTMPDQYTLAALDRRLLAPGHDRPVMIETALISSHAPWTPIPPLIDWQQVGDGAVFDEYARAGDPPEVVWQDADRVRRQYRKAIDYSLATLASFITERARDDLVIIVLGDHQPAPLITGAEATRDVPMHIIARDPAVLAAIDAWHWGLGMTPPPDLAVWPMDAFYERFLIAFSQSPHALDETSTP